MPARSRNLGVLALALCALAARAGAIYRCHALDGSLLFQDQPCDRVASTREARTGQAGVALPAAAPPAGDGRVAVQRYQRVIEQADREREAQARIDAADAARRQAEAAATPAPIPAAPGDCRILGNDGDCLDALYPPFVGLPYRAPARPHRRPPPHSPAAARSPLARPPPRVTPDDVTRQLLSTTPLANGPPH